VAPWVGVDQISDLLIKGTADVNRRGSVRMPPPTDQGRKNEFFYLISSEEA
jgi:hypothetical protein